MTQVCPQRSKLGHFRGEAVRLPEGLAGIWGLCFAWQGCGDMGYPFIQQVCAEGLGGASAKLRWGWSVGWPDKTTACTPLA